MYKEYFGLKEFPFSIAPDPRYLYLSEQHREALAHLMFGLKSDGGFVLLTGEVGTGKSTVCRCILEQIPENTDIAIILNPKVSAEELLASVCDELHIRYPDQNKSIKVFVDHINTYLLDAFSRGRKTVLIIEEAQNLSPEVLEQVRLLTNLETNQQKLLQVIMLGQPELKDILARSDMQQLSQRITARYHLSPLSKNEIRSYVTHRLTLAGVNKNLFPDSTFGVLYRYSRGIPRLINIICDRALLGAYAEGKSSVDKNILLKAAHEVSGYPEAQERKRKLFKWALAGIIISGFTAFAVTLYNYRLEIPVKIPVEIPAINTQKVISAPSIGATEKTDTLSWSESLPVEQTKSAAYQLMFSTWKLPFPYRQGNDVCESVSSYGIQCLKKPLTLKEILNLKRPAVLKLHDDNGRELYAALTSLQNNTATLAIGNTIRTPDIKELGKRWRGVYVLFWKTPPQYRTKLSPGDQGPVVGWLDAKLKLIYGKKSGQGTKQTYDDELVRMVKQFQLSKGLVSDGVVGSQTIIHLNNETGTDEPVLPVDKGEKK
jgi:general secretion pathway protein A